MLIQILINSLIAGLLMSLIAIGFNLIFNATKVFHLAHGAMYVSSVYALYGFHQAFRGILSERASLTVSIILSLVLVSVLIAIIELLVYRPLSTKNVDPAISMISSLGVYLFITNSIVFFFGNESISMNNKNSVVFSNSYFKLSDIELINLIISILLISVVLIFSRTRFYLYIRAIADSYDVAEKFGISVRRTRFIALFVGTILVGVAAILKLNEIAMDPHVGLTITLTASVAVIVGGVKSITGTITACLVIAIIENFSVMFLSSQWKDALTYTLLLGVLIFYQQGLISIRQRIETT